MANTLTILEAERVNIQFLSNQRLAYAYIEGKNFAKAKQYMTALQKEADSRKNPDDVYVVKAIQAYLDVKQGRVDDAIRKLSGVPENPGVLHSLVEAYSRKGDREKAKAALDRLNHWKTIDIPWAVETREAALMRGI